MLLERESHVLENCARGVEGAPPNGTRFSVFDVVQLLYTILAVLEWRNDENDQAAVRSALRTFEVDGSPLSTRHFDGVRLRVLLLRRFALYFFGSPRAVRGLTPAIASAKAIDREGRTLFQIAVRSGRQSVVRSSGARPVAEICGRANQTRSLLTPIRLDLRMRRRIS